MDHLKKRADFLRAARGIRRVTPSLTLETCPSLEVGPGVRIGVTATKKLGNAVIRNRAKRRLRAAAAAVLPLSARAGNDYVLVARAGTLTRDFASLKEDLAAAVKAAHLKQTSPKPGERS
ncbi:MAG TPA: ribonuclease P protein component [Rhizomicrobium sp.]|jgi:ribonuclease P protein component|nr:ribonuclease P protein component [Rhizomicrobium sp.]